MNKSLAVCTIHDTCIYSFLKLLFMSFSVQELVMKADSDIYPLVAVEDPTTCRLLPCVNLLKFL